MILCTIQPVHMSNALFTFFLVLLYLLCIPIVVLVLATLVVFNVNIIKFGIDQLHDSPSAHQSLFIHRYVWTFYLSVFIAQIEWSSIVGGLVYTSFINGVGLWLILPFLLCFLLLLIVAYSPLQETLVSY